MYRLVIIVGLIFISLAATVLAEEDPCDCKPKRRQYRSGAKHETNYDKYPSGNRSITSEDIISWQETYRHATKKITPHTPDRPRVKNTPEDTLYTLKGWMYFV